jgi:hypothetical protein
MKAAVVSKVFNTMKALLSNTVIPFEDGLLLLI